MDMEETLHANKLTVQFIMQRLSACL